MGANDNQRISQFMGLCLIGFAVACDVFGFLIGIIPIADSILSIFADIVLFLWFALLRVDFFGGRAATQRLATMMIAAFVELVAGFLPLLGGFVPGITIAVWLIIRNVRKEDKKKAAQAAAALKKAQEARAQALAQQQAQVQMMQMRAANDAQLAEEAA